MKNKKFYNNADRAKLRANSEKNIIEGFVKTFNKIKRINEGELSESLDSGDASSAKIVDWHNNHPTVRFIANQDGKERIVSFEDREDLTGEDAFIGTDQDGGQWSINVYYDRMTDEVQEWYLNTIEFIGGLSESDWREGPTQGAPWNEGQNVFDSIEEKYQGTSFTPLGKLNMVSSTGNGKQLRLNFSGDVPSGMKNIEIWITSEGQVGINISASNFGDMDELMITSETATKLEDIYQEFVGRPSGIHYHREDNLSKYSTGMYLKMMGRN